MAKRECVWRESVLHLWETACDHVIYMEPDLGIKYCCYCGLPMNLKSKPDAKLKEKPEAKPEPKPADKPDNTAEPNLEDNTDNKAEAGPENKPKANDQITNH